MGKTLSMQATEKVDIGSVIADKYQVIRLLGSGGMGSVFEAEHLLMQQRVAIKILKIPSKDTDNWTQRFIREGRLTSRIRHPNIVELKDLGKNTKFNVLYLVQELLIGQDLRKYLHEHHKLSVRQTIEIIAPVLSGLACTHRLGIIHRDLKAANILLVTETNQRLTPKVIDFGIAKVLENEVADEALTREGILLGTPAFMSPEQIRADKLTPATDLWAVGALMYRCLSGSNPFTGNSEGELLGNILQSTPPSVRQANAEVSPDLEQIIVRALAKNPSERYTSASRMLTDLLELPRVISESWYEDLREEYLPDSNLETDDTFEAFVGNSQSNLTPAVVETRRLVRSDTKSELSNPPQVSGTLNNTNTSNNQQAFSKLLIFFGVIACISLGALIAVALVRITTPPNIAQQQSLAPAPTSPENPMRHSVTNTRDVIEDHQVITASIPDAAANLAVVPSSRLQPTVTVISSVVVDAGSPPTPIQPTPPVANPPTIVTAPIIMDAGSNIPLASASPSNDLQTFTNYAVQLVHSARTAPPRSQLVPGQVVLLRRYLGYVRPPRDSETLAPNTYRIHFLGEGDFSEEIARIDQLTTFPAIPLNWQYPPSSNVYSEGDLVVVLWGITRSPTRGRVVRVLDPYRYVVSTIDQTTVQTATFHIAEIPLFMGRQITPPATNNDGGV